jgi:hypothetical protein
MAFILAITAAIADSQQIERRPSEGNHSTAQSKPRYLIHRRPPYCLAQSNVVVWLVLADRKAHVTSHAPIDR